jgi:P27 family predicted phage terminase small subunit
LRGRRPDSQRLKVIRGNPGGRKIAERPTAMGNPEPPDWLDEIAVAEWNRRLPQLAGIVGEIDEVTFALYCQAYSDYQSLTVEVRHVGRSYLDKTGKPRLHPLERHRLEVQKQLQRWAAEFGFTPQTRSRIEVPPPPSEEKDELEDFLS